MNRGRPEEMISSLSCSLMRTFVSVVELGGVTRAAEALHLAQSAVSAQMQTLSQIAGGPLLDRRSGRMLPTELGREVYQASIEILARVAALDMRLRSARSLRSNVVKLACTRTVCDRMLTRAVALFGRLHPEITITVESSTMREAILRLRDGRCDMVFVEGAIDEPELDVVPFHVDYLRLAVPAADALAFPERALTFEEISVRPFIMQPPESGTRRLIEERLAGRFAKLAVPLELESNDAIVSCVEEGLGLAFLSEAVLARPIAVGTLVGRDVFGIDLSRQFSTAMRRGEPPSDAVQTFVGFLHDDYDKDRRARLLAPLLMK